MVQCKKHETVNERFSELFNEDFFNDFLCIKKGKNITIINDPVNFVSQSITIEVKMCNQAVDPTCDDPKDIADYLANNGIQFAYVVQNDNMDHFNHSSPVQPFYFFYL